jgi:choline/glycine/proline betaine transport protein
MTFFGGSALHLVMVDGAQPLADAVAADTSVALFKFFEYLPLSTLASLLATVLVVTFFVTSSDSGSLVVDMLTSGGRDDAPVWQRIFWALLEGAVAAVLLGAGGTLTGLQGEAFEPLDGGVVASNGHIHAEMLAVLTALRS